jgi:hypothetical protein
VVPFARPPLPIQCKPPGNGWLFDVLETTMQDPQQQFMEFIRILREGVPISTAADVAGYTAAQVKKLRSNWEIDRQIRIAMAEKERLVLSAMLRSAADGTRSN